MAGEKLVKKALDFLRANPELKPYKGGSFSLERQGVYNPKYFDLKKDDLVDEAGNIIASKDVTIPREGFSYDLPAQADPSKIFRGMSAEEFANFQKNNYLQSLGTHNIGEGQKGLTYFSVNPDEARSYAHGFAPSEFKPDPSRPAYVVAAKRPPDESIARVPGTGESEVGVMGQIPREDVTNVYRGNVVDYIEGIHEPGARVSPSSSVHWEEINDYAHGGEVDAALHAVRHHLAGGGFLSDLFSGPDYLSTGEVASFANMPTQDETNADFFKADRALRLAREVQAPMTSSVPDRAPLTAPRPGPVEVQELPVNIPFAAPDRGVSMLSSDISPASVTSLPLSYSPEAPAAPAAAAIDAATGKMTARMPDEPHGTALTKQQADYVIRTIAAETSGKSPEETQAIASVILNRINSGKYGASPEAVLFAKRQFEPWMNPAGANYPMKISPTSQRYSDARDALEAAMAGEDITGGATHFWGPKAQFALGREAPSWGRTGGVDIGETRFHKLERAEGGEIHGDEQMNHDDIVAHALHRLRRHFDGSDGSYVDPMGNVAFPAAGSEREQAPIATDNAERMRAAEEKARLARDIQAFEASNARIDAQPQWAREMTHRPSEPVAPVTIDAFGRERVLGHAPYKMAPQLSSLAQFGYGLKTAPLYAAGAAFPPAAMLGTAIDTAEGIAAGSPTQVAMGAFGMPASAARNVFGPLAVASGLTAPDEAEAARAPKIGGALSGAARGELSRVAPKAVDPSLEKAFDIVRSATAGSGEAAFPQLPASVRALDVARGEAAPSDVVSGMTGAFAPKEAPIRGQTGLEIKAMQERALNPEEMDKLTAMRAQSPEFAQASRFMLPEELKGVIANPRQIEPMMRLLEVIPQAEQMSSLAKAGAPKQGWYRGSTQALMDVFGPQDAPRFSALLAATSPQTSVESNLLNTLNIWKNWEAAGRPTDPAAIKRVMGASVQGGKGEESVLEAWVNNSVRALSTPDPRAITLSGPKVNSFFRNLADDVYRVTNDAWISNATNIDQGLLRVSPTAQQLAAGNPGYSPGYLALSARQREGGQMARMLPSEAQETIWSVAMPLMEGATKAGMHPREFLQRGLLTPDLIRGTPDFSSLLRNDPRYANIIQQMGRGEQLEKMQPFNFPRQLPEMTASDVANLEKTADTLGNLRERRQRESRSLFPGYTPEQEKTFAHVTTSGIPGRGTGVAENLIDAPAGSRANFSSRVSNVFQDPTGMDILHKNLGLNPVSTVPSTEVWRPGMEGPVGGMGTSLAHATEYRPPLEVGRGYTASVEAPVTLNKRGQKIVDPAVERALEVASTLRGAMTAQLGTPHHALIGDPKGGGTAFTFPKKVDAGDQQARFGMLGALNTEPLAIADTGRTLSAFPTWQSKEDILRSGKMEPFTQADRDWMKGLAGATEAIPVTNIAGKKSYVDLSSAFAQPEGSQAVAKRLMSSLDKLTPEEFGRLDNVELRRAAGDLHDMYASQNAKGNRVRPDFLNMLSIMRDKGLKGLQEAYRKKEFLPVLAALGLGDQMLNGTSASGAQQ